jgi:hypothetical protein
MIRSLRALILNKPQILACTLLLALAGCASAPKQALDKTAAQSIRTIAVVEAREPSKYVTWNFGHPGMMFGAIGGAIAGASMEDNATKFTNKLRARQFEVSKRLSDKTAAKLAASGYRVVRVPDVREIKNDMIILDYKKIDTEADAILNVTPTMVGYISTHGFNDYIPALGVYVELVDSGNGKHEVSRLYQDRFMFGWEPSAGGWTHVPSPANFSYANFDDLMNRSDAAAAGLLAGAELIADKLASDIGRKQ